MNRIGPLVLIALSIPVAALVLAALLAPVAGGADLAAERIERVISAQGEVDIPTFPERSTIYAADGSVIATLHLDENREIVPLDRIRPLTRRAVLAAEDRGFFDHTGLDYTAIARAVAVNLASGEIEQGASTITQQLAKNLFTSGARTFERKAQEAVLAMRLESEYSKRELLERYLNHVYLGHGVYGVGTAAGFYFGKDVSELTLAEAALLAGMIASPERLSPFEDPRAARQRRNTILRRMADLGWVTEARAEKAANTAIRTSRWKQRANEQARFPYFVDHVRQQILRDHAFGETFEERKRVLFQGGLEIHTTLRPALQRAGRQAIAGPLPLREDPDGAIAAVAPRTGAIHALVGGRNFRRQEFNLATQARRQPGSAFKTFVLAAALQRGIGPDTAYSGRSPVTIPMPDGQEPWEVHNAGGSSFGTMDLRRATVSSVNAVYAQLVMDVGPGRVARMARQLGIGRSLPAVPSIALGSIGVTPLEMASAYATIANRGLRCPPFAIRRVLDRHGQVLYRHADHGPECRRVLHPEIARLVVDILEDAVTGGTGRAAALGDRPVFGKTGTTNDFGDAWFVGCARQLCASTWVGHREGRVPMRSVHGAPVYGGTLPARIWQAFMVQAMRGKAVRGFPEPLPWREILLRAVEKVLMPDVIGDGVGTATEKLERLGLRVSVSTTATSDPSGSGNVVAQSPAPGEQVPLGWTVRLTVLRYVEPTPEPEEPAERGGGGDGGGPPGDPPGHGGTPPGPATATS